MSKKFSFVVTLFLFVLLSLMGCTEAANKTTGNVDTSKGNNPDFTYPTNSQGQTYGTLKNVQEEMEQAGHLPDLVPVIADNGKHGYAYRVAYEEAFYWSFIPKVAGEAQYEIDFMSAVDAFCEYYTHETGVKADRQAVESTLRKIKKENNTINFDVWIGLSEPQKEAVMNLFPAEYRSLTLAQKAYEVALADNDFVLMVYALDGETKIGEAVIKNP